RTVDGDLEGSLSRVAEMKFDKVQSHCVPGAGSEAGERVSDIMAPAVRLIDLLRRGGDQTAGVDDIRGRGSCAAHEVGGGGELGHREAARIHGGDERARPGADLAGIPALAQSIYTGHHVVIALAVLDADVPATGCGEDGREWCRVRH